MLSVKDIIVEVRNKDLSRAGQIRGVDLDLDATPRFNLPGEWTLRLPSHANYPEYAALLAAASAEGAGIIVTHVSGEVLFSGPRRGRKRDKYDNVTLTGETDDAILWKGLAYADPANDAESRTQDRDTRTGDAETIMYGFVSDNIGPTGIVSRQHPDLTLGTDLGRGGSTTKSGTHQPLGELLGEIAAVAGLGFRVVQVGDKLEFQVYEPSDVTDTVRLDIHNGTLADQSAQQSAPSLTRAIVAGQGEGASRTLVEVTTADSVAAETLWGPSFVAERFIDQRQTDDMGELTAKGLEELLAGASGESVTLLPSGDSTMVFPTDWFLGDIVAVVVDGAEVPATVTSVTILANARYGLSYGVGIGEQPGQSLETRVGQLERNATGGSTPLVLQTYTPVLTAPGSNPSLGSGGSFEQSGRYWVSAEGIVSVQIVLRFGASGVSEGSGNYTISLPVPIDTTFHLVQNVTGASDALGQAILRDQDNLTGSMSGAVYAIAADEVRIVAANATGMVSDAAPWTWASGDAIAMTLSYKGDI